MCKLVHNPFVIVVYNDKRISKHHDLCTQQGQLLDSELQTKAKLTH